MGKMKYQARNPNPFVIGLTGTIGSGKSLVLKMLRHLGALVLDADWFAHQAYRKGQPGYAGILEEFGKDLTTQEGEIDSKKLGKIVFSDATQLSKLENMIHPIVQAAITALIQHPPLPIVAIEAIKLLESNLAELCDQIWIVETPRETVYQRLNQTRGLSQRAIDQRLQHQSGISERKDRADQIIANQQDVQQLWTTVTDHWHYLITHSEQFLQANSKAERILAPFQPYLLRPSKENEVLFSSMLKHNRLSYFTSDKILKKIPAADRWTQAADPAVFHLLCAFPTWHFSGKNHSDLFISCNLEKQQADIIGYTPLKNVESKQIADITGLVEDYSYLQICERVTIPFKGNALPLEHLGYHRRWGADSEGEGAHFGQEYNIYTKPLPAFRHK